MGVSITFTGDNAAAIRGDIEDLFNGGMLEIDAPDFETTNDEVPATKRKGRGRPKKAEVSAATSTQTQVAAASLPSAPPVVSASATAPTTSAPNPAPDAPSPSAPAPTPGAAAAPAAGTLTYDQVFAQVKAYNEKHGMEKARDLLLTFGCGMVRQLKPEQYNDVMQKFAVA